MNCPVCQSANAPTATTCITCGASLAGGASSSHTLATGTKLHGGNYTVGKVLGQGGFGITYKGGDMSLKRYVAIKEFFPHSSTRQGTTVQPPTGTTADLYAKARRDFLQEAQTLARFNHPGIVRVFGAFEENNSAYMVMEHLSGQTLKDRLDAQGVLPEDEAMRIVTEVGSALVAVHESGLLHRDIKPENILLTDDGRAVLIDFGTAREFSADKTKAMTAMLTPGYAPLEQYGQQAKFGPYTDVYALAATLYHCLTGQMPVSALDRLNGVELQSPQRVNPNVSSAVSSAVMSALEIKAPDRPQNVRAFLTQLQKKTSPLVQPKAPSSTPPPVAPRPSTPPPAPYPAPELTVPRTSSNGGWWNLIWIAALIWFGYSKIAVDPVPNDFKTYINDGVVPAFPHQYKAITALQQSQETERYSIDATLRQTCIPQQQEFVNDLEALHPETPEVRELHQKLLDTSRQRLSAYENLLNADTRAGIDAAYDEISASVDASGEWVKQRDKLAAEHDMTTKDAGDDDP